MMREGAARETARGGDGERGSRQDDKTMREGKMERRRDGRGNGERGR